MSWRSSLLVLLVCACAQEAYAAPEAASGAGATTAAASQRAQLEDALGYLDDDAGLIVSVRARQLQPLLDTLLASAPEQKGASDLMALAAIAILGFHPLQTSAWQAIGIDTDARILVQLATIDRQEAEAADRGGPAALWRTRIVLPVRDLSLASKSLARIRLRTSARLEEPKEAALAELLGFNKAISKGASEAVTRRLRKLGVFMIARPEPMGGLLIASTRAQSIVLDWISLYGPTAMRFRWSKHESLLLAAIDRRPRALRLDMAGANALAESELGVWIRPVQLATSLSAAEVDGLAKASVIRRHRRCEPFHELAEHSAFSAIGMSLAASPERVDLNLRWQLAASEDLHDELVGGTMPSLVDEDASLRLAIDLEKLGRLRKRERVPLLAAWDRLWNKASACGRGSHVFALAIAWPEIAGLFLEELSALDPSAARLIGDFGAASVLVSGSDEQVHLSAEAYVRRPSDATAARWLETLFGARIKRGTATIFGDGKMQPYAIADAGGSVIGVGLRPGSRAWAVGAQRRSEARPELISLQAQPRALQILAGDFPWLAFFRDFARAQGTFAAEPGALHFKLLLEQD